MPALEICDLRQKAVLWAFSGKQDRHGVQTVLTPVEIKVRWIVNLSQVIDAFGNTIQASKTVIADQEIANMSILWLGKLEDLPDTPVDLFQVIKADTTPDIKNRNTRFEYTLMKFSKLLPTVEV